MIPTIEDIVAGLLAGTYTKEQAIAWLNQHVSMNNEPEWWYGEDGDISAGDWAGVAEYADLYSGQYMKVHGAKEVCAKFVANVIKSTDDDGYPDETEYEIFDTEEEAKKATEKPPTEKE